MKKLSFIISIFMLIVLASCKNYYNETLEWMHKIEEGSSIEKVKSIQPDFVEIAWNNPMISENEKLYHVDEIDGNYDVLKMDHFLVFIDNKYVGVESHK